ncbi:transcriptional regulator, ArsR family [Natronoarchaeum philippinense]|uniref:Transcriptional regulator, ArsR family n=1 Tax=Natronoarchaeum philippinense TaxID=558529 RepID=A0A285P2S1_NATPI|nr:helix-turn-helix domain-containing protein [Natronoarchaeum philippinense]SNZ16030.1 transcriptional regulator, ArsR family [Natronoarchaeum philippinense]
MADLLPSSPDTSAADDGDPRVVGLDSDEADDVLAALSSGTARELLGALHDDPGTPSELADRVDTSLQNTQYHLEKLEDADVIRVIDTVYSEKGREMRVYAPTDQPLVVFAGDEDKETGLRAALSRLIGALGAVAGASLLVQHLVASPETGSTTDGGTGGSTDGGGDFTTSGSSTGGDGSGDITTSDVQGDSASGAGADDGGASGGIDVPLLGDGPLADIVGAGLPPGALFFAGGAVVVLAWYTVWYARIYRT